MSLALMPTRRFQDVPSAALLALTIGLLQAFPRELVLAVAGLALLGTITGGLAAALKDEHHRDAAGLTFLVTLSGITLAGIGAAFWGVLAGSLALMVQHYRSRPSPHARR